MKIGGRKKADQGITYMQALTKAVDNGDDEKEDKASFTEPMLLTVVTIEKEESRNGVSTTWSLSLYPKEPQEPE
jgi:hypothetical protein